MAFLTDVDIKSSPPNTNWSVLGRQYQANTGMIAGCRYNFNKSWAAAARMNYFTMSYNTNYFVPNISQSADVTQSASNLSFGLMPEWTPLRSGPLEGYLFAGPAMSFQRTGPTADTLAQPRTFPELWGGLGLRAAWADWPYFYLEFSEQQTFGDHDGDYLYRMGTFSAGAGYRFGGRGGEEQGGGKLPWR